MIVDSHNEIHTWIIVLSKCHDKIVKSFNLSQTMLFGECRPDHVPIPGTTLHIVNRNIFLILNRTLNERSAWATVTGIVQKIRRSTVTFLNNVSSFVWWRLFNNSNGCGDEEQILTSWMIFRCSSSLIKSSIDISILYLSARMLPHLRISLLFAGPCRTASSMIMKGLLLSKGWYQNH